MVEKRGLTAQTGSEPTPKEKNLNAEITIARNLIKHLDEIVTTVKNQPGNEHNPVR